MGTIDFLLVAGFVVASRAPIEWATPLLSTITPGAGGAWLLARAE